MLSFARERGGYHGDIQKQGASIPKTVRFLLPAPVASDSPQPREHPVMPPFQGGLGTASGPDPPAIFTNTPAVFPEKFHQCTKGNFLKFSSLPGGGFPVSLKSTPKARLLLASCSSTISEVLGHPQNHGLATSRETWISALPGNPPPGVLLQGLCPARKAAVSRAARLHSSGLSTS